MHTHRSKQSSIRPSRSSQSHRQQRQKLQITPRVPRRFIATTHSSRTVTNSNPHMSSQNNLATTAQSQSVETPKTHSNRPSIFKHVPLGPIDPILGITQAYLACTDPLKINVGVGAYRDENGKPWMLPSVKAAEQRVIAKHTDTEYLPIDGLAAFRQAANKLVYGDNCPPIDEGRVFSMQSLSGTGGLRVLGEFLTRFPLTDPSTRGPGIPTIYVSDPTWGTHHKLFAAAGHTVGTYTYWNRKSPHGGLDFNGMIQSLEQLPAGTPVVLHACAHNPTGTDPTIEQWQTLSDLFHQKGLFPIFDNAYQGYASGNPDQDAQAIRLFVKNGHEMATVQSFAKNFGLYGHRIGNISIISNDVPTTKAVESQMKIVSRCIWSSPPLHGARVVTEVLNSPELTAQWQNDLRYMANRIQQMRQRLTEELQKTGSKVDWTPISRQIGMFGYTGLTNKESQRIMDEFHVFMTLDGRISMAGVNEHNVERLAYAMHQVTADRTE